MALAVAQPGPSTPDPSILLPITYKNQRGLCQGGSLSSVLPLIYQDLGLPSSVLPITTSYALICLRLARTGDSSKLLTGSADSSAKLWDLSTGKELFTFKFNEPCRGVAFSLGDGMAAISSDPFMGVPSAIHMVTIAGAPHSSFPFG